MSAKEEKFDDNFEFGGMTYGEVCAILKSRYEEIEKHPDAFNPGLDANTYQLEGVKLEMESRMRNGENADPLGICRKANDAAEKNAT